MTLKNRIHPMFTVVKWGFSLAVMLALFASPAFSVLAASPQPVITVLGVTPQSYVQIRVDQLPASTDFTVTMSDSSGDGYGPTIAHFNSGNGGTEVYRFPVLASVRTDPNLAIRINSDTGFSAFASFENTYTYPGTSVASTVAAATPTATSLPIPVTGAAQPAAVTAPSLIDVIHAQMGGYVVVSIKNMPLNTDFTVMMNAQGTQGLGGYTVADLATGNLSNHIAVFSIPTPLMMNQFIDLRVEAPGYLYVTTFSNGTY